MALVLEGMDGVIALVENERTGAQYEMNLCTHRVKAQETCKVARCANRRGRVEMANTLIAYLKNAMIELDAGDHSVNSYPRQTANPPPPRRHPNRPPGLASRKRRSEREMALVLEGMDGVITLVERERDIAEIARDLTSKRSSKTRLSGQVEMANTLIAYLKSAMIEVEAGGYVVNSYPSHR